MICMETKWCSPLSLLMLKPLVVSQVVVVVCNEGGETMAGQSRDC